MKGGERTAKRSTIGTAARRRLVDITNVDQFKLASNTEGETNETIKRLMKRNEELEALLEKQSKIIEQSNNEVAKQRDTVQKLQKQNFTLAQMNNQLLAEVNTAKDRLKTMQHELLCNLALLQVKTTQKDSPVQEEAVVNEKNPRRIEIFTEEQETVEAKRRCMRRQSSNFKSMNLENSELSQMENASLPSQEPIRPSEREPGDKELVKKQKKNPVNRNRVKESQVGADYVSDSSHVLGNGEESVVDTVRRASFSRPSRRAAEKVISYKETSLRTKMRRN